MFQAISLEFTILGEIFAYVTVFVLFLVCLFVLFCFVLFFSGGGGVILFF